MSISPIVWRAEYSVENDLMDSQHQEIFNLINELLKQFEQHTEVYGLPATLDKLYQYSLVHFDSEEKLFDGSDYPDKINHKKSHESYREQIQLFISQWNEIDHHTLIEKVLNFVEGWWLNHIRGTDRNYIPYIR
jgi:hemerythrin